MTRFRSTLLVAAALLPLVVAAQSEDPAVKTDRDGTTVVGDRESPIGLYITPWRNAAPEAEMDRPARLLEEQLLPLDPDVFRRQLEYYNTITDHLASRKPKPTAAK
jgi:hypothetical protein